MGAVHGVYLKYVGISALSYGGYTCLVDNADATPQFFGTTSIWNLFSYDFNRGETNSVLRFGIASMLKYSSIVNGAIACLFKMERGMSILGKNEKTGQIPLLSYVVFFPFHLPSILYTHIHTRNGTYAHIDKDGKVSRERVPVATEVQDGWWIGGSYSHELSKNWGGVVDLTSEFPETCIEHTKAYLLCSSWDGVPPHPDKIDEAANFAVQARVNGDVLIHCAHGRGRSTTVMCAALVKAGLFENWEEALEKGIRPMRQVCKLNSRMKENLTEWQTKYINTDQACAKKMQ